MSMKRLGRVPYLTIILGAFVLALILIVVLAGESPSTTGAKFMAALSEGDVDVLVELSHMDGVTDDELREKWEYTTSVVGPHYVFQFSIEDSVRQSEDKAAVRMELIRNSDKNSAFPDRFELELRKIDDEWKVVVASLDREIYPGLPR
ncbi:MAG: hypothetical protein IH944_13500 [Armatimonadetes bacterium]|nr:hypothetical protein [Armatimonadota bacterium]